MSKPALILYLPVIHKAYIDFLNETKAEVDKVYLIDTEFVHTLYKYEPAINALNIKDAQDILKLFGFNNIKTFDAQTINIIQENKLIMIEDDVSRSLAEKYLGNAEIIWKKVFLRWDRSKVLSENKINSEHSSDPAKVGFMLDAYQEAEKSSDWWRQVGAVVTKDNKIVLKGYNRGMPDDHTPYQVGALRDYMEVGERPELASTIHSEQMVITEAAKLGISLKDLDMYVTHFPCAVCAKLIAASGIKNLYYGEGSSNADGETVLKSAKVTITNIPINK